MGDYLFWAAFPGQTGWFFGSLAVGVAAMLLYTVIRAFTRAITKHTFAVAVGDILFFALLGVLEFMFLFALPQNALRWFHILGQILGGVLFWVTLAPLCFRFVVFLRQKLVGLSAKVMSFTEVKILSKKGKKTQKSTNEKQL